MAERHGSAGRPDAPRPSEQAEHVVVDEAADGTTLAAVVRAKLGLPWSKAKSLCATGRVFIDGERVTDPAKRVRLGMRVGMSPAGRRHLPGGLGPGCLVHVDQDVLVLNKPAGLLTVKYDEEETRPTLAEQAAVTLKQRDGRRGKRDPRVEVVQRLDKGTSGLIVFARNEAARRSLKEQLRERTVRRRYLAIMHGRPLSKTHESWIIQDRGDGLRGSWGTGRGQEGSPPKSAKRAASHFRLLDTLRGASLMECRLDTGRQHQIRIHASESGTPLVGERVYIRDYGGKRIEAPRCMLHATELVFTHPRTGEPARFEQAPPDDFAALLKQLKA